MTPPLVLLLGLGYALFGWKGGRERAAVYALLLVWFLLPLVRIAVPRSFFYDGNRHFIEYVPALCAMAGGGLALAFDWLRARWPARRLRWALGAGSALGLAGLVWPVVEYHPYETTYFNVFAGGLATPSASASS
jgi:peptidoglycan/LPS O-acetylase OafA/YrhL